MYTSRHTVNLFTVSYAIGERPLRTRNVVNILQVGLVELNAVIGFRFFISTVPKGFVTAAGRIH